MNPTEYKVKKGDTLSKIAKQYGVGLSDISGYRSGNPDLIYEGETLSFGGKKDVAPTYAEEVKTQLTGTETAPKEETGTALTRTKLEEASKKREESFAALKDISTSTFTDEYTKRGLDAKKAQLSSLDADIAAERQKRDQAIAAVRSNPGLSAAQMTGDIKKLADFQNDVINSKIAERNALATDYNSNLSEIDRIVENVVKDKTLDYSYYDSLMKDLESRSKEEQAAIAEELKAEREADQFDRQLAQAMEIARMKEIGGVGASVGGTTSSLAGEWATLINEGRATIANVPQGIRTQVANALANLEPGLTPQEKIGAEYRRDSMKRVIDTIDNAKKRVTPLTAGFGGSIFQGTRLANLTGGKDLDSTLITIKANIGFEALQAMREASKTGGALGQTAVQELEALQAVLGSLDSTQSPATLLENLDKIKEHYRKAMEAIEGRLSVGQTPPSDVISKLTPDLSALRAKYEY